MITFCFVIAVVVIVLGVLCILTFDGAMMVMGLLAFAMSWCSLAFGHYMGETNRLSAKTQCILSHTDYLTACRHFGSDDIKPFGYWKALLG